jgi:succinate dehydrogenase / fumarate reductase cytochrome b subunit
MGHWIRFASSSIGRKQILALTGMMLCGFLAGHLAGNFLLYAGPEAFNHYADFLAENPLLPFVEACLAGVFMLHVGLAVVLTWENWKARPEPYAACESGGGRTLGSSTMIYTGGFLFAFLLFHVFTFKLFPIEPPGLYGAEGLYGLVGWWFQKAGCVAFYVAAMAALATHLSHGCQSAVQTLGLNHPRYMPGVKAMGLLFALGMAVLFGAIPVWSHFVHRGMP